MGDVKLVISLLARGADVNQAARDFSNTPLMVAAGTAVLNLVLEVVLI
jgi:hypothetical protein